VLQKSLRLSFVVRRLVSRVDKHLAKISKFLSLVLRHEPEAIGIALSDEGWVDIDVLLEACRSSGRPIARTDLDAAVESNDKKRFTIEDDRIRANQGHSISVDLSLEPVRPPQTLYHGTAKCFLESVISGGIKSMNRQHVHLSADFATAVSVGKRHGQPIVLTIDSQRMYETGHQFYFSKNEVWLTNYVPPMFVSRDEKGEKGCR